MKLQARFIQLPVQYDAELLAREIATIDASAWKAHPAGYEGNDFLPLISVDGNPDEDFGALRKVKTAFVNGRLMLQDGRIYQPAHIEVPMPQPK